MKIIKGKKWLFYFLFFVMSGVVHPSKAIGLGVGPLGGVGGWYTYFPSELPGKSRHLVIAKGGGRIWGFF